MGRIHSHFGNRRRSESRYASRSSFKITSRFPKRMAGTLPVPINVRIKFKVAPAYSATRETRNPRGGSGVVTATVTAGFLRGFGVSVSGRHIVKPSNAADA